MNAKSNNNSNGNNNNNSNGKEAKMSKINKSKESKVQVQKIGHIAFYDNDGNPLKNYTSNVDNIVWAFGGPDSKIQETKEWASSRADAVRSRMIITAELARLAHNENAESMAAYQRVSYQTTVRMFKLAYATISAVCGFVVLANMVGLL